MQKHQRRQRRRKRHDPNPSSSSSSSFILAVIISIILSSSPSTITTTHAWYLSRSTNSSSGSSITSSISESQSLADATKEVINQYFKYTNSQSTSSATNALNAKEFDSSSIVEDGTSTNDSANNPNNPSPPPEISFLFPSLFSTLFTTTTFTSNPIFHFLTKQVPKHFKSILFYKPPLGITSMYIIFQYIMNTFSYYYNPKSSSSSSSASSSSSSTMRMMMMNDKNNAVLLDDEEDDNDTSSTTVSSRRRKNANRMIMRKKRIGRSLELDELDGKMMIGLGGVDSVRTELCLAALEDYVTTSGSTSSTSNAATATETKNPKGHDHNPLNPNLSFSSSQETNPKQNNNIINETNQQWNTLLHNNPNIISYYASTARKVLQMNASPMSSRMDFVERTIDSLVLLQHYDRMRDHYYYHHTANGRRHNISRSKSGSSSYGGRSSSRKNQQPQVVGSTRFRMNLKSTIPSFTSSIPSSSSSSSSSTTTTRISSQPSSSSNQIINDQSKIIDIIWMSSTVAQLRSIDSLLRTLRDRLVISANRLSRKEKYRVWRLQWYENAFFGRWMRRKMKNKTIEDDRRNLQLTRAALKRELERLGQVQGLLLNRPCELSETRLLTSVQATLNEQRGRGSSSSSDGDDSNSNTRKTSSKSKRKTVHEVGRIDGAAARQALFRSECNINRRNNFKNGSTSSPNRRFNNNINDNNDHDDLNPLQEWTLEAQEWNRKGRSVIAEVVTETISDAFEPTSCLTKDRQTNVETDLKTLSEWASGKKSSADDWYTVLALFDCLSKARLLREHKYLPISIDFKNWFRRIDVFGIPSSLATIGASLIVHNTLKPYWPDIVEGTKSVGKATWGLIEFRFVTPFKDIALDLLNRRPKLLDPFELSNEETSLDNMLHDLGIGDGTKEGRKEALASASRMYESEMAQGVIRNFIRGEMVRLLLIQVQQLKTGLLQAMGSIDDLIDANRLNVQLLATIPAVLLVTVGTRVFFRALYGLRSKDIVGLPTAHAEMKDLLMKMERCLLLSSHTEDNVSESGPEIFLKPDELGEFVLYMHTYLSILDFCSPPFPTKTCDAIHSEMQELLMQGQLSTKRQIALLKLIGAKHDDLLKSI